MFQALTVTAALALSTTAILFLIGVPLGYVLARCRFPGRTLVETLVLMPLVLPPTVLGFYLLVALGPHGLGTGLPFTFPGILLGSVLFNLPFAVRPICAAFASVDQKLIDAGYCLGVSRFTVFRRVTFPLALPGIVAGMMLTLAHTVGEFGVILMIGGNRPGVTRTLSMLVYDDVQAMDYTAAHRVAAGMVVFSLLILTAATYIARRHSPKGTLL